MTTITLDLPDDLVEKLQNVDLEALIERLLRRFFNLPSAKDHKNLIEDEDFKPFTILPPNPADDFVLLPPVELPEPEYRISVEEWKARVLALSNSPADDTPLEPPQEMALVPPDPLPEPTYTISKEEWLEQLLAIPVWDEDVISEIEKAREYINQWKPKEFF
ncbi:hypothetical protein QUF58_14300 [Anaerolineales bacterium HSG24]|nr:hypothetical protein [Anaerolineales bacterium HSG24]